MAEDAEPRQGDIVRYVGPGWGPIETGTIGVVLHTDYSAKHPFVYAEWEVTGSGGVPASHVELLERPVRDDGPESS
jgi:hypothetical protein